VVSEIIDNIIAPLFVPGDRPERFIKAALSGADAIIVDLEDAVAPNAKVQAREALRQNAAHGVPVIVRINARGTMWHDEDVACVDALNVAAVMLPKTNSSEDVSALRDALGSSKGVIALIESAQGIASARVIAASGAARLAFGSIDYCADLGCAHTRDALLAARSELVLASKLADLAPPLDGVTAKVDDPDLARSDARHALELGFGGKLCIHPKQIALVLEGFAPSEAEIKWAEGILAKADHGAVTHDGMMIDAPVRANAQRILARRRS